MNTARLKNIVILILLLANAFLLVLLLSRRAEERSARERAADELLTLYQVSGISLDRALIEQAETALPDVQPTRDSDAERTLAEGIIGSVSSVDSGGGIYRYYSADSPGIGSCLIRSGGTLEADINRAVTGDATDFCAELCSPFGYTEFTTLTDGDQTVVTAHRLLGGHRVYNCSLTFSFTSETLTAVTGSFLPPIDTADSRAAAPDVVTALVHFLDYRNASGVVCTEIRALSGGYLLQSTTSAPLQLTSVLRVETDVYNYYVNFSTGEVIRE